VAGGRDVGSEGGAVVGAAVGSAVGATLGAGVAVAAGVDVGAFEAVPPQAPAARTRTVASAASLRIRGAYGATVTATLRAGQPPRQRSG